MIQLCRDAIESRLYKIFVAVELKLHPKVRNITLATLQGDEKTQERADGSTQINIEKKILEQENKNREEIIEAQGWIRTAENGLALVAQAPNVTFNSRSDVSACKLPQQ